MVHLDLGISPRILEKNQNDLNVLFRGLGKDDSWKKTWSKKSRDTVPLKQAAYNKTCWMGCIGKGEVRGPPDPCARAHAYTEYTQSSLNFRPWGPRLLSLRGRSVAEKSQFWPYHFLATWWSAPTSHFSHWSLPWNEQPMGRQDFEANANERQDTCNMKKTNLKCEYCRMSTAVGKLHR